MYIPGRERKVIELLLHADEEMTVKKVAKTLEVSERTIHRDLKSIEKVLATNRLELIKKAGVGLRILGTEKHKQQMEHVLSGAASVDFTPEERQTIIFSTLLEANEPVKLFTLADALKVTPATVSHDLTRMEETMEDFHLSLIRRRGYGVKISGNEGDKRAAISHLISQNLDPFDFVSLLKENIQKKSTKQSSVISNRLLGLVNPENLAAIEKRVEQTRAKLPYELADSAYVGLVVHLALAIERLQKGDTITFDPTYLKQIEGTKEYHIAGRMIGDLEKVLNMDIPHDEIGYITMHLLGAKLRLSQHDKQLVDDGDDPITLKAKELIQYIGFNIDVDFSKNTTLLHDLVAHLKPAIFRLQQDMNISNPLVEQIRSDYDDLFSLVQEGAHTTFPELNFPDDEIGYLVLHFAAVLLYNETASDLKALVICSSGIGTAKILANKLMQQVPEINKVDNVSMFDLRKTDLEAYDIVVSTIPLQKFDGKYILASPMLTDTEVQQIKKAIRQRKLTYQAEAHSSMESKENEREETFTRQLKAVRNYSDVMLDLLKTFRVILLKEVITLEDSLLRICNQLDKDDLVTNKENVLNKLLEREKLSGLGIPGTSLALYHTRSDDIERPHFSVHRLSEPLSVTGMDGVVSEIGTLLIMLAPETVHQEALEVLSYLSSVIIKDQASITLFESGNEAAIRQFLSEQFHQFLLQKNILS